MSIYPVRLSEWFPKGDPHHSTVKLIVSIEQCTYCKKKNMHWQDAIADHSLPWGYYNGIFCKKKCFDNYRKKT